MSSPFIQNLIHKLEVGSGARYLWGAVLGLVVIALFFGYNIRAYRNLTTPEAMDTAQLAHNISGGRGYTTSFIRPFSLFLVQRHLAAADSGSATNTPLGPALITTAHPDLANAPVFPFVLASLMKVLPFDYTVNLKGSFWTNSGTFWRYQPDFLIALFNELLLIVVVIMTFLLAKKLFDAHVAWLSAALVLGCEVLWQFSVSGLSTILLLVIYLGVTLLLLGFERESSEAQPRAGRLIGLAVAVGILTGVGALTRYSFGWAILPVVVFLFIFCGPRRPMPALAALAAFALILTPWIIRNEAVSGTVFGTAGYSMVEGTAIFPEFKLERSIHPDLNRAFQLKPTAQKLLDGVREIMSDSPFKSGASWAGAFFFAGLFLGFRNPGTRRIRYFLLMCLGLFIVVQSLGRTQLSVLSPVINSENLLVLLVPLVFIFGASFFYTLLEQMTLPVAQLRYVVIAAFVAACYLPMLFTLWNRNVPVVYPPYYPPKIQAVAGWMKPDELMMSDVPWAVAWYGNRPCVWLTLDAQDDFFAVNSLKPVQALYLTPETMDGKFVTEWLEGSKHEWGTFLLQVLNDKRVPDKFPLTKAPAGFFPEQLFLTDRERWPVAQ